MADHSSVPEFDLDTAISADLDGELDAYATDLGVPIGDVRAAIATPRGATRRAELAEVRDALARPHDDTGPDDVTRRRLLAGAGVGPSAARRARDHGFALRAGAAAAVTLVVVGSLYAIFRDRGGSGDRGAKSASGGSRAATAVTGDVGDLGPLDAAEISRLLRGDSTPERSAEADSSAPAANGAFDSAAGSTARSAAKVAPRAVDACATQFATAGTVRFRGSGAYGGRPAVVLGVDTAARTIVFVVAADDCTQVLYSASR